MIHFAFGAWLGVILMGVYWWVTGDVSIFNAPLVVWTAVATAGALLKIARRLEP